MPIHLDDLDVISQVEGLRSVLIVPCYMCPAVSIAVREHKPFIQLFTSFLKSPPFEEYIRSLRSGLREKGVSSKVFKSRLCHHWFLCMWTSGRRKKLQRQAEHYEAVIVLGCDSATETVQEQLKLSTCKVIQGMEVRGLTNAKLRFHLPCNVSFQDSKIIPLSKQKMKKNT